MNNSIDSSPFFSVIIPVYNKDKHILRAVNSVKAQIFQDFEIIIVCDPSSDKSNEVVAAINDDRLKVFHRDEPGPGGYAARNLGISKAKGQWLAFLDADDEWLTEHLQKMYELSVQFPNVFMMGCGWKNKRAEKVSLDKYYKQHVQDGNHLISVKEYLKKGLHGARPIHTSLACVKRSSSISKELFIIHPEVKRGGDLYAWLKMICYHKRMAWSNHVGASYYLDASNMVTKTAASTAHLMNETHLRKLSEKLNKKESVLLQMYFNRWLRNDWKSNIHRGCQNFNLGSKLFWKGSFVYALVMYITTVWPQSLRKWLGGSGRKH